jgi:CheY-like chemotaxis protein
VHEAVDAASALAALRDGALPDLLLSDHAMPGMPGMDLLRQVRREWPALPCMLVTGYADDLGEDVPGVERLPKPFLPRELVEAVARAIARSTEAA